jgi:hypothetical protein
MCRDGYKRSTDFDNINIWGKIEFVYLPVTPLSGGESDFYDLGRHHCGYGDIFCEEFNDGKRGNDVAQRDRDE